MSIQKFVVSRDESIYEAFPDMVQTNSGNLVCVFLECEHHCFRDNSRLVITKSTDRGRTWSKKVPLTDKRTHNDSFNCPRISKLLDGRLAIICDKMNNFELTTKAVTYVWYGDSEGENWEEPVVYDFNGVVPDKLLQLKNGRMIISNHCIGENNLLAQHMWYSDDNGKTWSDRITIAEDSRYNLCEVSILECENNMLVAFLRENSFKGYSILKVISYDNGETWSQIYDTPISCGHRPVSGFLKDGSVMITHRYIPGDRFNRMQNVFATFFPAEDLEKTERNAHNIRTMPIDYDRNADPDIGYTGWTQFDDGEIYMVNYIKDDSAKAQIRGYSFYPEDIVLP